MIGMVLVNHGRLATELIAALEHVVGAQDNVAGVCIGPDDDMEVRRAEIVERVTEVDDGSGVVVLTDMFGGTPSNLAISIMDKANIEVIAGVNLPMLIKLASIRSNGDLSDTVVQAQESGPKIHQYCVQTVRAVLSGLGGMNTMDATSQSAPSRTLTIPK